MTNFNRNLWEPLERDFFRDPFRGLDRALDFPHMGPLGSSLGWPSLGGRMSRDVMLNPAVDVRDLGDSLAFHLEAPGCSPENLHVDLKDGNLVISGEKEKHKRDEGSNYIHEERSHGSFSRSFRLPEGTKPEDISANFNNGVLDVSVKKAAGALTRIAVENRRPETINK
jgi:HSP20 family molecular chaperone IbpA